MSQQPSRVLRSLAVAVASSAGILALAAAPAAAQACYPPGPNCVTTTQPGVAATITVSDRTLGRGQAVVLNLTGFRPGSVITVTLQGDPRVLATVTADAQGRATVSVTIPEGTSLGRHDILATGVGPDGQPLVLRTRITVVADRAADATGFGAAAGSTQSSGSSGNAAGGSLAKTGATFVLPAAAAGLALVGSGVLLRRTVKRRKPVPA